MDLRGLLQDILNEVSSRIISFQMRLHLLYILVRSSEYFRFIESLRTCIMASQALVQCSLFWFKCSLAIDIIFFWSFKTYSRGHPGSNQGPHLLDCSWVLYHWAISPLHTDSITSLPRRSGCLSTVTMFFVPSQVFSRYRCRFSLVFQKLNTGTPGFIAGTSRTDGKCSTEQ